MRCIRDVLSASGRVKISWSHRNTNDARRVKETDNFMARWITKGFIAASRAASDIPRRKIQETEMFSISSDLRYSSSCLLTRLQTTLRKLDVSRVVFFISSRFPPQRITRGNKGAGWGKRKEITVKHFHGLNYFSRRRMTVRANFRNRFFEVSVKFDESGHWSASRVTGAL